jgi:hypothetical protein
MVRRHGGLLGAKLGEIHSCFGPFRGVFCPPLVSGFISFLRARANGLRWVFCGALVALFAWNASLFYLPGQGFTYMIQFGSKEHDLYLPELRAVNHFEMPNSMGYDSQWYAQIAMRPHLGDPVLRDAVDGLHYRARRILFPAIASLLAWGDPMKAMHIYAFENIACWFLLALLLFRWFPPVSWGNCVRWGAVLFSFGLIFSVERALLDGPSLLLIAVGMALVESGRPWLAAVVLGISGLGKDTNVLCGAGMKLGKEGGRRAWVSWLVRSAIVVLPLVAWMAFLQHELGHGDEVGTRNFTGPFAALAHKLVNTVRGLFGTGYSVIVARYDLGVVVGLMAQFAFFVFRWRWKDPWWRLGATYAVLMVFLGDAVWENYPSAAARVLLPMTLAFNILVPRKGWWPLLLIVGNLGVFGSYEIYKPPGRDSFVVEGPRALHINPKDGNVVEAVFGPVNWALPERSKWAYWRWCFGDATVALRNPQPFTIESHVSFRARPIGERQVFVFLAGKVIWQGKLDPLEITSVDLGEIDLPQGDTVLTFKSDRPGEQPTTRDPRNLTFSLRDLEIDLERRK